MGVATRSRADEIFQAILRKRGLDDETRRLKFLKPLYGEHLHDPFLMPDMEKAIKRLKSARKKKETVVIYGDYDIDGLSATALLKDAFERFGFSVHCHIPDRFEEGYGLNTAVLERLAGEGFTLAVTVDCGSRSITEIKAAKKAGLDVIVTDHHETESELPPAVAVLNPKRAESTYPFRDLAGVGVAFKLVQAMQREFDGLPEEYEKWLLDFVALGTICDVVDLVDENRCLVYWGLKVLARTKRPGLVELAHVARTDLSDLTPWAVAFQLGPRLNAAGRIEHAKDALALLTTRSRQQAMLLAFKLDRLNAERRYAQGKILKEAMLQAEAYADEPVLVLADPGWSHGIVGIVASKLVEQYRKPVFVMQVIGDKAKGSARSFGDFHLADALLKLKDQLITGGGHKYAAGCTIAAAAVNDFRKALCEHYRSLKLNDQAAVLDLQPDVTWQDYNGFDEALLALLTNLEPFGRGNEQPLFRVDNVRIADVKKMGQDGKHLRLMTEDSGKRRHSAVAFNYSETVDPNRPHSVWFHFEWSNFRGVRSMQQRIQRIS